MRKKKLYPILIVLVVVICFFITLTSCKEWFGQREPGAILGAEDQQAEWDERAEKNSSNYKFTY